MCYFTYHTTGFPCSEFNKIKKNTTFCTRCKITLQNVKFLNIKNQVTRVGVKLYCIINQSINQLLSSRERLQQWLLEKGKTPSRYSHLLNFQRNTPADRLRRERRRSQKQTPEPTHLQSSNKDISAMEGCSTKAKEKLDATLNECLTLLQEVSSP